MRTRDYNPYQTVYYYPLETVVNHHNGLGHQYWSNGYFAQAIESYLASLAVLSAQEDQHKNLYDFAIVYYYLAENYRLLGDLNSVDQYYALIKGCIDQCNQYGVDYGTNGNFAEAIACHQKALNILSITQNNNLYDYAMTYSYIAEIFKTQDSLNQQIQYYSVTKAFIDQCNNNGIFHRGNGNFAAAIGFHEQALEIILQNSMFDLSLAIYYYLSANYKDLAEWHVVNGDLTEAIGCYERVLQINGILSPQQYDPSIASEYAMITNRITEINAQMASSISGVTDTEQHSEEIDSDGGVISEITQDSALAINQEEVLGHQVVDIVTEQSIDDMIKDMIISVASEEIEAESRAAVIAQQEEVLTEGVINIVTEQLIDSMMGDAIDLVASEEIETRDRAAVIAQQEEVLIEEVIDIVTEQCVDDMLGNAIDFALSRREQNRKKREKAVKKDQKIIKEKELEKKENSLKDQVKDLNELANQRLKEGKLDESIALFTNGLRINKIIHPNGVHLDVAISYSHLGNAYLAKGVFASSIQFYKKSATIYKILENYDDVKIASDKVSFAYSMQENILENSFNEKLSALKAVEPPVIDNPVKLITANNNYDLPYVVFFAIKELIEKSSRIKYFATEILHLDSLVPTSIKQIELPEFLNGNFFWVAMYYGAFSLGIKPLAGNEFSKAIFLASLMYGFKLSINDYVVSHKQSYLANNKPGNFIDKCGYLIALQVSIDSLNKEVNKLIVPEMLEPFPHAIIMANAAIEGMQCYKFYKQQETAHQPSIISQAIPYFADFTTFSLMFLGVMNQNRYLHDKYGHSNKFETMIKMVYVVEGAIILDTVVAVDHISKLVVFTIEESLIYPAIDYLGKTYHHYFDDENL